MANKEQVLLLRDDSSIEYDEQGNSYPTVKWNKWRIENSRIIIDLTAADFSKANLSKADLSKVNLSEANLREAKLRKTNLSESMLSRVDFRKADLRGANLREANLSEANLAGARLESADLGNSMLSKVDFTGVNLADANLTGADLSEVNLAGGNLRGISLVDVNLTEADITGADLSGANLRRADLSGARLIKAKLSRVNLREANLSEANLSETNFIGINLTGARLIRANLTGADLRNANFIGANLTGARLIRANLIGADLREANLSEADLRRADLSETDLSEADFHRAVFSSKKQLSGIKDRLSDAQMAGILFKDEEEAAKQSGESADKAGQRLNIKLDAIAITPFNLSYLLLALEGVYNNLFYLSTTEEQDYDVIENAIQPYFQGVEAKHALMIQSIKEGSFKIDLVTTSGVVGILLTLGQFIQIAGSEIRTFQSLESEIKQRDAKTEQIKAETRGQELDNIIKAQDFMQSNQFNALIPQEHKDLTQIQALIDYDEISQSLTYQSDTVKEHSGQLLEKAVEPLASIMYKYGNLSYTLSVEFPDETKDKD